MPESARVRPAKPSAGTALGATLDVWEIKSTAIEGRVLSIIVPKGSMTEAQKAVFEAAKLRARAFDIDLIITPF